MPIAPKTTVPPASQATPAPAPANNPEKKASEKTEEQPITATAPTFLERSGWNRPAPEPEKPKEPAAPAKPTEPATDEKPTKVRKVAKGYEAAPSLTKKDLQEVAASAAAAATAEAAKMRTPAPPTPKPAVELTPAEKRRIGVLEEMGRANPQYANLAKSAQDYIAEYAEAEAAHNKAHPDEPFDEDKAIQNQLRDKHSLVWDENDYDEAERRLLLNPVNSEVENLKKEVARLKEEKQRESLQPVVSKATTEAQVLAAELLGDDFKAIISNGAVSREAVTKLVDEEPFIGEIVEESLTAVKSFAEAVTLVANGGVPSFRTMEEREVWARKNPELARRVDGVNMFCFNYERDMAKAKPEDRQDSQGREFLPRSEYLKLPAEEQTLLDSGEHPDFWMLTPANAINIGTQTFAEAASARIKATKEKLEKSRRRNGAPPPTPTPAPKPASNEPPPTPTPEERVRRMARPISPTSYTPPPTELKAPTGSEQFTSRMFAGRTTGGKMI